MDNGLTPRVREALGLQWIAEALSQALQVWDDESFRHSVQTAEIAAALAREMGFDAERVEEIRVGALLHDIGKIGVDLAVLKKPGSLSPSEETHVRLHPSAGASILERVLPAAIVECALHHHEQPDGLGYPNGLRGDEIPLSAAICRVADVLDSLTSPQTYRDALSLEDTLAELRDGRGSRYDAATVDALIGLAGRDGLPAAA